ncbi:hypothetical protein HK105_202479 [Polyrhizophydium stewartii]|uniref:MFS transporter n=1 Tax=Polyrhizophydium stewartii TaxID=2732419 RepID=A0ABR4NEV0_9FUNG
MGLLPAEFFSQPLSILSFVLSCVTAAANQFVAGLIASRLIRSRNAAWRMFALLALLNLVSILPQTLAAYRIDFETIVMAALKRKLAEADKDGSGVGKIAMVALIAIANVRAASQYTAA